MQSHKKKLENEPAFVLHSYPYRETSLILEALTRQHGRVALVARGARRPRSILRGSLMSFQPLTLSWFGKHELRTLHSAEWQGGQPQLYGKALLCGLYLNELLLNLMVRDDPHEKLFDCYKHAVQRLATEGDHASILRCFEKHLLQELGYALLLTGEADSNEPIDPSVTYCYVFERGAVRATSSSLDKLDASVGVSILGKTLQDIASDDYCDTLSALQSKQLMRMLLNQYLAGKTLHTRELIKDLQRI